MHTPTPATQHTFAARGAVLRCLLAGLTHSLLLALAFPPVGWWPLALAAPIPLVWLAKDVTRLKFLHYTALFVGVLTFWLYTVAWTFEVAGPGYPCLAAIQSVWAPIFVWCLRRLSRRGVALTLAVPLAWTGIEFIRGELFADGFAWSLIAYPLIDSPALAAPATITGVYGVGFLTALLTGSLADALPTRMRRRAASLIGLAVWVLVTLGASLQPAAMHTGPVSAVVLQTNVPQSNKIGWTIEREIEDYERFERLSRRALAGGRTPDLLIWPETMLPGLTLEAEALAAMSQRGLVRRVPGSAAIPVDYFADRLRTLSRDLGVPMLVGEDAVEGLTITRTDDGYDIGHSDRYNSVYLLHNGEVEPTRYDKVCLTPFGETMPYISNWPWLERQLLDVAARGMTFDLSRGRNLDVFEIPRTAPGAAPVRAVTPICFEITVGPHCRRLVYGPEGRRADLIVNVTNDGWFGDWDVIREQHLQIARWRCLELGTPMVRAANTGISALVDTTGRLIRRGVDDGGDSRAEGTLSGTVELRSAPTIYGRAGDVLPWTTLAALLLLLAWSFTRPDMNVPTTARTRA